MSDAKWWNRYFFLAAHSTTEDLPTMEPATETGLEAYWLLRYGEMTGVSGRWEYTCPEFDGDGACCSFVMVILFVLLIIWLCFF